jgi:DNA-binding response OmpR family regulator
LPKVLLIEDEPLITDPIKYSLKREGFDVDVLADGSIALDKIESYSPDVVVLDIMLPGMDGMEICRRLRTKSTIPVIMLTALGDEPDRILGLDVGADDYLSKPFSFRELLARIRAVLRRVEMDKKTEIPATIEIGNVQMDFNARRVFVNQQKVNFSSREFDLLAYLMQNAGRALSREELLFHVWGDGWIGDPRTLDVHVRWLRLKIEDDPASPSYIQTVRGYGYRFIGLEEYP